MVSVDRKEAYEVLLKQAMNNYLMSVDKAYLAIILELCNPQDMFEALDYKYSATNAACLHQLLRDCQAISMQKKVPGMEKYVVLNLNTEIRVQKKELAFQNAHLINFFLPSMTSSYEGIINNLNMKNILTLEGSVRTQGDRADRLRSLQI